MIQVVSVKIIQSRATVMQVVLNFEAKTSKTKITDQYFPNFSIRSCVQPENPDCVKWDTSGYLQLVSSDRLKPAWKGYWTIHLYIHHFILMFFRYITNQFSNSQLACYNCSSIVRPLQHWYHSVQGSTPDKPEFLQAFFRTCMARLTVIIFSAFISISEKEWSSFTRLEVTKNRLL